MKIADHTPDFCSSLEWLIWLRNGWHSVTTCSPKKHPSSKRIWMETIFVKCTYLYQQSNQVDLLLQEFFSRWKLLNAEGFLISYKALHLRNSPMQVLTKLWWHSWSAISSMPCTSAMTQMLPYQELLTLLTAFLTRWNRSCLAGLRAAAGSCQP